MEAKEDPREYGRSCIPASSGVDPFTAYEEIETLTRVTWE